MRAKKTSHLELRAAGGEETEIQKGLVREHSIGSSMKTRLVTKGEGGMVEGAKFFVHVSLELFWSAGHQSPGEARFAL